ncbi:cytochrome c [Bradyrhizobium sp. URHD0069]|uniref:c-type cytochrome n=1 Tax=Bradyrhizobium sp. URHD0069 TaxID=1380355 RepID=UPI000494EE7D
MLLHGIASPVSRNLGYMPAFNDSMTDDQIAELVSYLRRQFAPDKQAWTGVQAVDSQVGNGYRAGLLITFG